jgi:hypothetical protein
VQSTWFKCIGGLALGWFFFVGVQVSANLWNGKLSYFCDKELAFKRGLRSNRKDLRLASPLGRVLRGAAGVESSPLRFLIIRAGAGRLVRESFSHALIALEGDDWVVHVPGRTEPLRIKAPLADDFISRVYLLLKQPSYRPASFKAVEKTFTEEVLPILIPIELEKMRKEANRGILDLPNAHRLITYLQHLSSLNAGFRIKSRFMPEERDLRLSLSLAEGKARLNLQLVVPDAEEVRRWLEKLEVSVSGQPAWISPSFGGVGRYELLRSHFMANVSPSDDVKGKFSVVVSSAPTSLPVREALALQRWALLLEAILSSGAFEGI